VLKIANLEDVTYVATRMRAHDAAERVALSHGDDPVLAAVQFLKHPHLAVTVWGGKPTASPIAVIGVVFPHPGVASTIFFATDEFRHVARATTRFIRRQLIPILLNTGIHRLQVCSMYGEDGPDRWITSFGVQEGVLLREYGKNREDFMLYALDKAGMERVTSVKN
jgi:hypothetical protein